MSPIQVLALVGAFIAFVIIPDLDSYLHKALSLAVFLALAGYLVYSGRSTSTGAFAVPTKSA